MLFMFFHGTEFLDDFSGDVLYFSSSINLHQKLFLLEEVHQWQGQLFIYLKPCIHGFHMIVPSLHKLLSAVITETFLQRWIELKMITCPTGTADASSRHSFSDVGRRHINEKSCIQLLPFFVDDP